ncbi:MAG: 1-acyl-sn-glycerol-3-phosphate acyltransferase [Verrucomicrobiales bacterium]|nr:1-acyl-sn-glycerol-3-phosphate acyltransferase [Verrucomicrobiales bacterium]
MESPTSHPVPAPARPGVPSVREIWRRPLPHLEGQAGTRYLCRILLTVFHRRALGFEGLEHIQADQDPFVLALNHSQRPEAVLIPAWLCFHRGGRMVHFLADWNFLLVPGLAAVIRRHDPIVVVRKDARPRFLNRFKDRFRGTRLPFEEAGHRLRGGRSVGIFPEATVNRDPGHLLRGQSGVARLALETGVSVVPGGVRFPTANRARFISDSDPFRVRLGPPIQPGLAVPGRPSDASTLHAQIMGAISTLSGKEWQPDARRTKHAFTPA